MNFCDIVPVIIPIITAFGGVYLGFYLSFVKENKLKKERINDLKKTIRLELESLCQQIIDKKQIIKDMENSLRQGTYKPGESVPFVNIGYTNHIAGLYEYYSPLERNSLHFIYAYLDIVDNKLFTFERDLKQDIHQKDLQEEDMLIIF